CVADQHHAAVGTGNRALDQQQVLLRVDGVNGQVLHGGAGVAVPSRHAEALEDATGGRAAADRARRAVLALGAVRGAQAVEAVALHDTRGALALARAGDVDLLAGLEDVGGDLLAEFVLGGVVGAQFDEVAARRDAGLLEVTRARLVHLARVDLPEPELHGGVAVLLRAADLGDDARPGLDDGHRNDPALIVEDLGHAELLAQDALPLRTHLSVRPLELDLDVDAGRKVEPHERVDRLGRRIDDVDQPLVRAHLEVLAAVLVLVRRADDAVHVLLG